MMNKATFYALLGAVAGHFRQRVKKRKPASAAKGAVLGFLFASQVAPRINLSLPAPSKYVTG